MKTPITAFLLVCTVSCGFAPAPSPIPVETEPDTAAIPRRSDMVPITVRDNTPWQSGVPHDSRSVRCVWVFDGDTLKTDSGEIVRLLGVNTPEIAHPNHGKPDTEPYGGEALEFLRRRLAGRRITLIVPREVPVDRYGRTLALVLQGDSVVNLELIEQGLARYFMLDNRSLMNANLWLEAQDRARKEKRGLWSVTPEPAK